MSLIQVTQFFDTNGLTWEEAIKGEPKGVLPSTDGKIFLWAEKPKIVADDPKGPPIGYVWYERGIDGFLKKYRANYDTSD